MVGLLYGALCWLSLALFVAGPLLLLGVAGYLWWLVWPYL